MRTDPAASLNIDSRSLDSLRSEASRNPKAAARQAAVQFESLFMQMVVKSMRDATPKTDPSQGGDTFTGMLDTQLSKQFAGRPGGLADMIERQLTRHMQNLPAVSPENLPSAGGAAGAASAAAAASTRSGAATGAGAASAVGAPAAPGVRQSEFIQKLLPHAREAERQTGVPASFILGQAALESGWGKGEIRNADGSGSFNLFGIKAGGGWQGATSEVMTTEYADGQPARQRAAFRSYGSYTEAFTDYARLLSGSSRYAGAVRGATSAESFAQGMQRAGYATDPQYASKLARTINQTLALQRAMG
jgi:flagellar protein FlgJ